ncbi:MAG: molecular chaperone DnaK [Planctomycetaceae bacterium]|nr:MAG: molecular chaperone DnaK [Planctomycetaceae bacterium]
MKNTEEQASQSPASRYVVGIDLGTTNSAVAYCDTQQSLAIQTFRIPQLVAPGVVEWLDVLPSFHYQPASGERSSAAWRLPWSAGNSEYIVGTWARDQGMLVPGRQISSAKSWLCHRGVDRTAEILPWQGADDVVRLSPVAVSARYLSHLRAAWDHQFPEHPLGEQDVVLTLPASFDEVARELTLRAAREAGLTRVTLLEEPQAAFYAWIDQHASDWHQQVQPGHNILICDIGGGTTDFTLIRVKKTDSGQVQFHRVAVGEHLILGGDNFDLALAYALESRLVSGDERLDARSWGMLVRQCRQFKELMLGKAPPDTWTLSISGEGSRLIGRSRQVEVRREEVQRLLLEGFFPLVPLDARPETGTSGFAEFGLPYARDAAITRHLAWFLVRHATAGRDGISNDSPPKPLTPQWILWSRPDWLLFNGGVFESAQLKQRLIDQFQAWFGETEPGWRIGVLDHARLDLAVAHGAAYYGLVRRGLGVRIAAGLPRAYYLAVGSRHASHPPHLVCLCPAGLEPGQTLELSHPSFTLTLGTPVEFPLYQSSTRQTDQPGQLVPYDRHEFTPLAPIRAVFKGRSRQTQVEVTLAASLTEIGTLDVWCREVHSGKRWKLPFAIRNQSDEPTTPLADLPGYLEEAEIACAQECMKTLWLQAEKEPVEAFSQVAAALGIPRQEWPPLLLRALWETLIAIEPARHKSSQHEARWLNMLGYCLRPGYGVAADDWRVQETWKLVHGKLIFPQVTGRVELWVLWRRIAAGLSAGQQQALFTPIWSQWSSWNKRPPQGFSTHEWAEQCRLIGALEALPPFWKQRVGEQLWQWLELGLPANMVTALWWSLGRLGARQPVAAPWNCVLPIEVVSLWLQRLMKMPSDDPTRFLAAMQWARLTTDRYRDIERPLREQVIRWLEREHAPDIFCQLVQEGGWLPEEQQGQVFGEALPPGLHLS